MPDPARQDSPEHDELDQPLLRTPSALLTTIADRFLNESGDGAARRRIEAFSHLNRRKQKKLLTPYYIDLENLLIDGGRVDRESLHDWVRELAPELLEDSTFEIVLAPDARQSLSLCFRFLDGLLQRALAVAPKGESSPLEEALHWIQGKTQQSGDPLPLGMTNPWPRVDDDWSVLLQKMTRRVHAHLIAEVGREICERVFADQVNVMAANYAGLEAFGTVVAQLPNPLISPARLALLSRPQLEYVALSKSQEATRTARALGEQSDELERLRGDLRQARTVIAESVREFRSVLDAVSEAIITTDSSGTVVLSNRAAERLWGSQPDELFGRRFHDLLKREGDADGLDSWSSLGHLTAPGIEAVGLRLDGSSFPLTLEITRTRSGDSLLLSIVARDEVSEDEGTEQLRESHERYALAMQGANHGLWDWDLERDVLHYSPQWCRMLGLDENVPPSPDTWFERIHPDERDRFHSALRAHLEGRRPVFEIEHRVRHEDGTYRWMLIRGQAVLGEHGRPVRIAGSQIDLTERKVTDALTGLPNRVSFLDRLTRSLDHKRRDPTYLFAVLFVDIDAFKVVNDSLGHIVGDQLLLAIAQRLEACVRTDDMVARMGGDEFTVLLDGIAGVGDAKRVADRFHKELKAPFYLRRQEVFATASIGIAMGSADYVEAEDLLRDADTAMYRAKALGKARYEVFDLEMRDRVVALMQLHTDLRRAVQRNEFELFYQPIVSLASGETEGFEALVRWRHPERGLVFPGEFISVAEETGLIQPLGRWVLREACRQAVLWQAREEQLGPVSLSVNLSAKQFARSDLAEMIRGIIRESKVEPSRLKLEITESMIMRDEAYAVQTLSELRSLGIAICIDDFGTGYSSLSALHRFPIDMLKIDRSFVHAMQSSGENEIVETIIGLAHNLGMVVTAEGVETIEQLEMLRAMGCDYWQGYYYTKPVSSERAIEFLGPAPKTLLRPGRRVTSSSVAVPDGAIRRVLRGNR